MAPRRVGAAEELAARLQAARLGKADTTDASLVNVMMGYVFPFIRTPWNIFRTGIRKTPLGMFSVANNLRHGMVAMYNGQTFAAGYPRALMIKHMAEQFFAMATMGALWQAGEGDDDDEDKPLLITGSRPWGVEGSGTRDLLNRTQGGEYQIRLRLGDKTYRFDYGRIEPFSTVLATVVDGLSSIKRMNNGADKAEEVGKMLSYLSAQAENKTFLQGFGDVMETVRGQKKFNPARTLLTALVPNLIRQPLRNLDDYVRDTKNAPWYYHALPAAGFANPRYDLYGNPIAKASNPLARVLIDVGLDPYEYIEPADKFLTDFNRENPDLDYAPGRYTAYRYKGATGKDVQMTPDQIARFDKEAGKAVQMRLRMELSPVELAARTEATKDKISNIISQERREVKSRLFEK